MTMKVTLAVGAAMLFAHPVAAHPSGTHPAAAHAQPARTADEAGIRSVLRQYQAAVERLDARGTERLFTSDSAIFESGGVEGNYANYLAHHLTPELGEFKSFHYSNYKVEIRFEGPVALATESYTYRIETKKGEIAERLGVATCVLKKVGGRWKVSVMHNSARKPSSS